MSRWTTRSAGGTGRRAGTLVTLGVVGAFALTGCSSGQVAETAIKVAAIPGVDAAAGDVAVRNVVVSFPAEGFSWPAGSNVPLQLTLINNGNTGDTLTSVSSDIAGSVVLQEVPEGAQATIGPTETPSAAVSETVSPSAGASVSDGPSPSGAVVTGTPTPTLSNGQPSPAPSRGTPSPVVNSPLATASAAASLPLDVPAKRAVPLQPGGPQLVLVGITKALDPAATVAVTLTFENGGAVTVNVPFAPPESPLPRTSITHAPGEEGEHSNEEKDAHTE
ncbi:copper chaperone PCu(A)C [Cryptosporangium sp. NPDC048952]|uniref:copper chaperone PCu(A)C n=1 Tax=Cryptosporangium sp. NPDC048952 TaxID=3363961 RepID=UPI00372101F1